MLSDIKNKSYRAERKNPIIKRNPGVKEMSSYKKISYLKKNRIIKKSYPKTTDKKFSTVDGDIA
jgi:hypothetical protein